MNTDDAYRWRKQVLWGLALIILGTVVLLDRLGHIDAQDYWHYAPLLLVVIGVAQNDAKGPLFSTDERVEMLRREVAQFGDAVEVRPFSSLLMHFAEELNANCIVRGLRAVADFEYEFQMTAMNQRLNSEK